MEGGAHRAGGAGDARLILFDIDGTLLLNASAEHAAAVMEAIEEVWRVRPGDRLPVEAAGRTDTDIAREILLLCGVAVGAIDDGMAAFREFAVRRYAALVPGDLSPKLAPGAAPVVAGLATGPHRLALVTGNLEPVARLKLTRAGIGRHFAIGHGGFGSDSEDRSDLPPLARARAATWNGGAPWPSERTVVVGDTPRDIACARADGAHVIAVTTGPYAAHALAGADAVIAALAELPAALDALG